MTAPPSPNADLVETLVVLRAVLADERRAISRLDVDAVQALTARKHAIVAALERHAATPLDGERRRLMARARLELTAELLDWRRRTLSARQGFAAHEAVGSDDAAGAVAAFDRGLARVLDDLTPWVETAAARWSRP